MLNFKEIEDSLNFLIVEVNKQVSETLKMIESWDQNSVEKIVERDDYIDNLKGDIENKCFSKIIHSTSHKKEKIQILRAIPTISDNLENIGDFAVNILKQMTYLSNPNFIKNYDYIDFFNEIILANEMILKALEAQEISGALQICRSEFKIDKLYQKNFKRIVQELEDKTINNHNLLTTLFIFHYLERMGDSLLNIGEAIIFSILGERLKIHQYEGLEETLEASNAEISIADMEFQSIWGTKSGCRIGKVYGKAQEVIYKEGNIKKLKKEKEKIEKWHTKYPGLPPKIIGFQEDEDNASLLLECFDGPTIKECVLLNDTKNLQRALEILKEKLVLIWNETKKNTPTSAKYVKQIYKRLDDVFKIHPEFETTNKKLGSVDILSLNHSLKKIYAYEKKLHAPFSILGHGDFNIDNIIYVPLNDQIHFIDLHRSAQMDYVQDVSTFILSNFRFKTKEKAIRKNLNYVILQMYHFAQNFAQEQNDTSFEMRLSLGLIRSFITSTRFELKKDFAKSMFLRANYLIQRVINNDGNSENYFTPQEIIIH